MVNVVDDSLNVAYAYKENNFQLAKENNELKQQSSQQARDIATLTELLHRKDVENNNLKQQLNEIEALKRRIDELEAVKQDYRILIDVVRALDTGNRSFVPQLKQLLMEQPPVQVDLTVSLNRGLGDITDESSFTSLTPSSEQDSSLTERDSGNLSSNNTTASALGLDRISEHSEVESDSALDGATQNDDSTRVDTQQDNTYNDSLDPPDVTSVPPLVPERIIHTPSIWKCLDQISTHSGSDENSNVLRISTNLQSSSPNQPQTKKQTTIMLDLYQSTPVQANKAGATLSSQSGHHSEPHDIDVTPIAKKNGQENVQLPDNSACANKGRTDTLQTSVQPKKTKGGTKRKAVQREVVYTNPEPPRYNLRKRTKV